MATATPAKPAAGYDLKAALKEAGFAALVTLGLCIPIIAWGTRQNMDNVLVLDPRWDAVAWAVGIVFVGRFLVVIWPQLKQSPIAISYRRYRELINSIALGLIAIGILAKTIATPGNPAISFDWNLLKNIPNYWYVIVAASFYFLLRSFQISRKGWPADRPAMVIPFFQRHSRLFSFFGLGFLAAFPAIAIGLAGWGGALKWVDNFGVQILIYVMLGWGLNIVVGLAGLLDLGYVAFYAVGAYSYALLAKNFGLSFWMLLPLSGILAAFWGMLLGFPVLRLRGDYLAIVTLAFGEIIRLVLVNWTEFSNGYAGISGIPRPTFFGIPFTAADDGFAAVFGLEFSPLYRTIFLYYLILCLALLTAFVTLRLRRLPVGRAWEALREDEIACRSLGINTTNTKLTAFALGAMFGGFAGAFFSARQGFISPESFTFMESAVILAIVVLGGMGSLWGVAIAAIVMIGGTEFLRELDWMKAIFGDDFDPTKYRMLIFGFAMVVIMIWKPRGLISTREPTAFLKEKKQISADLVQEGHG